MQISYWTSYFDLIASDFYTMFRSPIFFGVLLAILIYGIGPNWSAATGKASEWPLFLTIMVFIILELIPIIFGYAFMALALILSNLARLNKTVPADYIIIIGENIIHSESKYSNYELNWNAVWRSARTKSHIFLYVMKHGVVVIPKRAFATNEEREKFWAICQTGMQMARQVPK